MSLKLFHTADIHLGSKFNYLGEKASEQRKQLEKSFEGIVENAIKEDSKVFLIAGDLFDSPFPAIETVNFAKLQINKLIEAGIFTGIIAGNHDFLALNSVYNSGILSKISDTHFHIFDKSTPEIWELPELNAVMAGASLDHPKNSIDLSNINKLVEPFKDQIMIGLFHGSIDIVRFNKYNLLNLEKLKAVIFDYVALGDWHSPLEISKNPAINYCGSPEMLALDQTNSGKFLVIDIDKKNKVSVVIQTSGKRFSKQISIDIELIKTPDVLLNKIKELANKDCVLEVLVTGFIKLGSNINFESLQESLANDFFALRIKDQTKVLLDEKTLAQYPQEMLIGKFISTLAKKGKEEDLEPEIVNKAMQVGVSLLGESI